MEQIYQQLPHLSQNIAKFLPPSEWTWKEAEQEFEKQFLQHSLESNLWQITKTAKAIDLRPETLGRKIKKLKLKK
jgi:transcriptional regulator with GAF, ATPase, and Fis domain